MNKRFIFILLPFLTLLFSVFCTAENISPSRIPDGRLAITSIDGVSANQHSVLYQKNHNTKTKFRIRIKAWDGSPAIDEIVDFVIPIRYTYSCHPEYGGYQCRFVASHLRRLQLRGPPAA